MKILKNLLFSIFLIIILTLPFLVFASPNPLGEMKQLANEGGYTVSGVSETTMSSTIGTIVQAFLGLLGIIFIILMVWAGYNWMTAGGNEDKVAKARTTIYRAIIGLIITTSSYAIWRFIFMRLLYNTAGVAEGPI
ncbi:hypothetical protein C0584_06220 [Candidatus Parcubacteria bacterium]|nr:MAG: hypothetical protein C0584_06220 [Candidatus Parcubacteria bacterium]